MKSLKKHEEEINLQLTERFVDQWRRYNDRLVEPPGLTPQVSMPESPTAPRGDDGFRSDSDLHHEVRAWCDDSFAPVCAAPTIERVVGLPRPKIQPQPGSPTSAQKGARFDSYSNSRRGDFREF